jgi:hypothetical protein
MNKEAFERGFLKAALYNGVQPLVAVNLLKQAFNLDTSLAALKSSVPDNFSQIAPQTLTGLGIGGATGALTGAVTGKKGHKVQQALIDGGLVAATGGLAGAATGMYGIGNDKFNATKGTLGTGISAVTLAKQRYNQAVHNLNPGNWFSNLFSSPAPTPGVEDPEMKLLLAKQEAMHSPDTSFLHGLMGSDDPTTGGVLESENNTPEGLAERLKLTGLMQ